MAFLGRFPAILLFVLIALTGCTSLTLGGGSGISGGNLPLGLRFDSVNAPAVAALRVATRIASETIVTTGYLPR
jgi:hypothetical protein